MTNGRNKQSGWPMRKKKHRFETFKIIQDHPISILARSATHCGALRSWHQHCAETLSFLGPSPSPASALSKDCRDRRKSDSPTIFTEGPQKSSTIFPDSSYHHRTTHLSGNFRYCLVGGFNPTPPKNVKKMMEWKSDWIILPTIGKNKCSKPPTSCLFKIRHFFLRESSVVEKTPTKKSHHPNHPEREIRMKKNTSNLRQPNSNTISTMEIGNILQHIPYAPCVVYLPTKLFLRQMLVNIPAPWGIWASHHIGSQHFTWSLLHAIGLNALHDAHCLQDQLHLFAVQRKTPSK